MKRWPTKPLDKIADVLGGSTPSRDNPSFWGGKIPWVTPTDLPMPDEGISVVSKTKERITQAGLDNSSATLVPKGTVLFSSRATIGKVAVADMELTTNQGFANFIPHSEVISRFLAYALWFCRGDISRLSGSTTFREVNRTTLRKFEVPVPPLDEQVRIVELLDEADEMRKLRAQADRRTATLIPALFHEMFGDPATNPHGWPVVTLGEISGGGQYGLNAAAMTDGVGVRFIRITDIDDFGRLGRCETAFVPGDTPDINDYELIEGDILIARTGATAGKAYVHQALNERSVFAGYLIRFKINKAKAIPIYVFSFLKSNAYWTQLNSHKRAVAQPNVNAKQLASLRFPLPPLPLQKEFAQGVTEIREIETAQSASQQRLGALFQSLLYRAFNGEL